MASPQNVMALLLFATLTLCTGQQELNITSSPSGETSVLPGESAFISMLLCPASQHSLKARVRYNGEENSSHHEFVAGKDLSYYETERDGFLITNWASVSPDDVNCTEMVARIINTPLLRSNDNITFTFEVWDVPTRRQVESRTFVVTLLSPTPTTTLATATTPPATPATTAATTTPATTTPATTAATTTPATTPATPATTAATTTPAPTTPATTPAPTTPTTTTPATTATTPATPTPSPELARNSGGCLPQSMVGVGVVAGAVLLVVIRH